MNQYGRMEYAGALRNKDRHIYAPSVRLQSISSEDAPWEIQLKCAYPDVVEAVNRQTNIEVCNRGFIA